MDAFTQFFLDLYKIAQTHTFYLYFLPIVICIFGYLYRINKKIKTDTIQRTKFETYVSERAAYDEAIKAYDESPVASRGMRPSMPSGEYYHPSVTVGSIVGSLIVSVLPVVNLCMAVFWFLPTIAKDIVDLCSQWLDIPLVPKRDVAK